MRRFKDLPENIWVLAEPDDDGMYTIHARVHPNGKSKSYPNKVSFQDALNMTLEMQEVMGLPDDAVMMSISKAVVDQPIVLNRKMKNFMASKGMSFNKTKEKHS